MDSQGIDKTKKSGKRKIRGKDNTMELSSSIVSNGDDKSTIVTRPMIVEGPPKRFRSRVFPQRSGTSLARSLEIPAPKIPTGEPITLSAPKITTGDPITFASPMDIETDGSVNNPAPQKPRLTRALTRTLKMSKSQMPFETFMTSGLTSTGRVKTGGTKATRTSQKKVAETKTPTTGFADLPGVRTPSTSPLKSAAPSKRSIKLSKGRPPLSGTSDYEFLDYNVCQPQKKEKSNVATCQNLKQPNTTLIGPVNSFSKSGSSSSSDSPVDVESMHTSEGIRGNKQTTKEAEPVHFGPSTSSHRFDQDLNQQEAVMFQQHNTELFLKRMKRKTKMIDGFIKNIELGPGMNVDSGISTPGPSAGGTPGPSAGATPDPSTGPTPGPSSGPTPGPSAGPTPGPLAGPSAGPSFGPTPGPSAGPSAGPSFGPTPGPSAAPSDGPSFGPTPGPLAGPSAGPSFGPTPGPSAAPSAGPSFGPTPGPSAGPRSGPWGICSDFANDICHIMVMGEILSLKIKAKFLSEIIEEYAEYFRRRGDMMTAAALDALK